MMCGCAMAGTKACFTCPNSMAGTYDRYPAPYYKRWDSYEADDYAKYLEMYKKIRYHEPSQEDPVAPI